MWKDKIININGFARSGKKLTAVRKIVIHWTANYGASAENHYRYFNNLTGRYASAHFFVDKYEALCIIPLDEVAYHANDGSYKGIDELKPNANYLSLGIELCVEKDGSFHPDTIKKAEAVAIELCKRYFLNPLTDIVRHYDVTHKNCPAPWVKNIAGFNNFKNAVKEGMSSETTIQPVKPIDPTTKILKEGDKNEAVEYAQTLLNKFGYKLVVDGHFGKLTLKAVIDFQAKNKLSADGVIGSVTWSKLTYVTPAPKPEPKPEPVPNSIGSVVIETEALNIRKDASLDSQVIGTALKNAKFPVFEIKNGMFKIAEGKWISGNEKYSKYTANPVSKPAPAPVVKPKSHVVADGETFYGIADKYDMDVKTLQEYNSRVKADELRVGDVIHLIPFKSQPQPKPQPAPKPKPTPKPQPKPQPKLQLTYKRTLKQGMQGSDVKALQEALNKLKFNVGTVDGDYGAKTKDAVRRFQSVYLAYEVDGIAGKNTIAKINSLLK